MNSYPSELLAQHAPLMFAAGLEAFQPVSNVPTSPTIAPPTPLPLAHAPKNSFGQDLPDITVPSGDTRQDPFASLAARLRGIFSAQRKGAVWDPERAKSFHTVLVDKAIRLPPRKVYPSAARSDDGTPIGVPHSPLSPLTPTSPLYPDGLIAPIWVRKHIELVPSVFVLFLRLWEGPPPKSPLESRDGQDREEERDRDATMSNEIAGRKKTLSERGIKLTVVLMATRKTLDDPALDSRLSYIRRQSGLDSRAALFVLSPVNPPELVEFVKSLQDALYEPSMEYYNNHSKRVRRKRNRQHSYAVPIHNPVTAAASGSRPLRGEGWSVRYEYKMATFAEFRSELEVARKHYEDCWLGLVDMFSSTAILPPRTKRWAEAKVLADCVAIKICKLYLYHDEHSRALAQFNRHLQKFGELSRGWGIGEETFEFWGWMARQYRILAEVLEQALRSGLRLPTHTTSAPPSLASPAALDGTRNLGINPSTILHHPGYYFYAAAICTQQRRSRYMEVLQSDSAQSSFLTNSPGFINEKKVDHYAMILDFYTNAYELFKKYAPTRSRMILYVAYRIAETYHASGQLELAVSRFFERIAHTHRREKWGSMLQPLLSMWYDCAKRLEDADLSIKLMIEILAPATKSLEERASIESGLLSLLKNKSPSAESKAPLVVELSDNEPIFDSTVVFWQREVLVDDYASFQLTLSTPDGCSLSDIPFSSVHIHFSDGRTPVRVVHRAEEGKVAEGDLERIELGDVPLVNDETESSPQANLRWGPKSAKVFAGTLSSPVPCDLRISNVVLTIVEGDWTIELPFDPSKARRVYSPSPRWLSTLEGPGAFIPVTRNHASSVRVRSRPHLIHVAFKHDSPAYVNERYPVIIEISNVDERDLQIHVDALLQPTEDDSVNDITIDDQTSTGMIKGVDFGTVSSGDAILKTIYLMSRGSAGERVIDISIQSRIADTAPDADAEHASEMLQTLVIPTSRPLDTTFDIAYHRVPDMRRPLLDLATFDADTNVFDARSRATIAGRIICAGPSDVELISVRLDKKQVEQARLSSSSLDETDDCFPLVCRTGDAYLLSFVVDISTDEFNDEEDEKENEDAGSAFPGTIEVMWRRAGSNEQPSTTQIFVPRLRPPEDGAMALVRPPPTAILHTPFALALVIKNEHSYRTADVVLQLDSSESSFVVSGPRNTRLKALLPGAADVIWYNIIPLECGRQRLPTFRLLDRRKVGAHEARSQAEEDGDGGDSGREEGTVSVPIPVLDLGFEARDEAGRERPVMIQDEHDPQKLVPVKQDGIYVFVLPS
ncbi:hypothetical protein BOTBODRAFT_110665 [Botryobasidium botryosum FD-172 SS1]|uniref:Trafficking protein particle complex subunit 11 domain-containing protein n=1 Tax=Botryobasidium botryosum (strain FD-172 SS1) TaxID=930990 RepID=A0A067MEK7_BOTB1|nr:hypothetical protein BOTBODRAFT_110665 [Botryobasidium botryosum FD-172 SS1]